MERRSLYLAYLKMKTQEEDWHGVADAAMDLRELDAATRERNRKPRRRKRKAVRRGS